MTLHSRLKSNVSCVPPSLVRTCHDKGQDVIWKIHHYTEGLLHLETIIQVFKVENWCQGFLVSAWVQGNKVLNPILIAELIDSSVRLSVNDKLHFSRESRPLETLWMRYILETNVEKILYPAWRSLFVPVLDLVPFQLFLRAEPLSLNYFQSALVNSTITRNFYFKPTREGVHDRRTNLSYLTQKSCNYLSEFSPAWKNSKDNSQLPESP